MNKSANAQRPKRYLSRRIVIAVAIIVALLLFFDISPFGGNIRFYSKWLECGQKPLEITSAPGAGFAWHEEPQNFNPIRLGYSTYFCTPEEAETAGYASSSNGY